MRPVLLAVALRLAAAAPPAAAVEPPAARPPAAPRAPAAAPRPSAGDKCPVCGMFVAKYPDWAASAAFEDGTVAWFDGAKDLFKFLARPERYLPSRRAGDVVRITVTDYYSLAPVDAHAAWYVVGSDVSGPMGAELVPFAREGDAREFMSDHRGAALLRFGEVGPDTLRRLEEPE